MKNVAVITSTRAEYGLLQPIIRKLREYETISQCGTMHRETHGTSEDFHEGSLDEFRLSLVVTGTHLSEKHGNTISEIRDGGVRIDEVVEIGLACDTPVDIARNQADIVVKFTDLFMRERYNAIIILGDRYEMQMIAIAATNAGIPIFHIGGGDTTEGAVDEAIRHSITKMSYMHFASNECSRRRVIQLGELPERVFNVGSPSVDNILNMELMDRDTALASVGLSDCRYALGTYHPVTLEAQDIEADVMELINAIKMYPDIQFIITKANADKGGDTINAILEREEKVTFNMHVFASLGVRRYLSLMKHAELVIGNSSSGITETPSFHVPTVNIGDRQKGRLQAGNIINCGTSIQEISDAIAGALTPEWKMRAEHAESPYGDGHAAEHIAKLVMEAINKPIELKKKFYDMN